MTRTLESSWESYEAAVVPPNAGSGQRRDLQMSFYAGAASVLATLAEIGDDSVTEDAGVAMLRSLASEVQAHVDGLTRQGHGSH